MHTFTAKMALPFWLKLDSLLEKLVEQISFFAFVFISDRNVAPSFDVDAIVPEQTEGALPPVSAAAIGSLDSFQHVEAVMKEDDVSTIGLDSQDWEMVSEMVADTENAATDFMHGKHVALEEPMLDLQSSLQAVGETMVI